MGNPWFMLGASKERDSTQKSNRKITEMDARFSPCLYCITVRIPCQCTSHRGVLSYKK